ncbi:hypothetical protein DL96DRAFT_1613508 [Flagelloscypha sp. PMI_526]|nr:hypothetical protein DL96DRAFT_1613508 [Flagelloscypha sp. PMI_526]
MAPREVLIEAFLTANDDLIEDYKAYINLPPSARGNRFFARDLWEEWVDLDRFEAFLKSLAASPIPEEVVTQTHQDTIDVAQLWNSSSINDAPPTPPMSIASSNDFSFRSDGPPPAKKRKSTSPRITTVSPKKSRPSATGGTRALRYSQGPLLSDPCPRCVARGLDCHLLVNRDGTTNDACYHCRVISHVSCNINA